jgi:serine/threonine protein kinase
MTTMRLLNVDETDLRLLPFLEETGHVFAVFDRQDSGCLSVGVDVAGQRLFLKTAGNSATAVAMERVRRLHARVTHRALVPLVHHFTCADGPVNVFPWKPGQVLYHPTLGDRPDRTDPAHPMARFRALPLPEIQAALDDVLSAHEAICAEGWLAVDFYDGCLLYDFEARRMRLVDLDEYRPGPFSVPGSRLPGSTRYLSPEEMRNGGLIDERTTVHALGRMLRLLMDARDDENAWRGSDAQLRVVSRATDRDPRRRWASVQDLRSAWSELSSDDTAGSGPPGVPSC